MRLLFVHLLVLGLASADNDPTDGNDQCTTDKTFVGYNRLFFPNRDKFTNRPKCDPLRHFGLDMVAQGSRGSCIKLNRDWWAIQIIPLGFNPTFKAKYDIKAIECKDKNGDVTSQAVAHTKLELHPPGEICMSVSRQFEGAQQYQVMLLSPKLDDDPTPGVQVYQSPRFVCEFKRGRPSGSFCKLENPQDIDLCDTDF